MIFTDTLCKKRIGEDVSSLAERLASRVVPPDAFLHREDQGIQRADSQTDNNKNQSVAAFAGKSRKDSEQKCSDHNEHQCISQLFDNSSHRSGLLPVALHCANRPLA